MADTPSDVETAATRGLLRPVSLALLALSLFAAGIFAAGRFAPAYVASASEAPPVKSVELVRLIEQVKSGLADAELAARANNQMTLFKLDSFDLEVNVVARAEGKSSIKLWTVGSDISTGSEKVQKVHLHWTADPEKRTGVAAATSLEPEDLAAIMETSDAKRN